MRAVEAGARTDPLEAAQRLNSINAVAIAVNACVKWKAARNVVDRHRSG
jgi:hypothetical protein